MGSGSSVRPARLPSLEPFLFLQFARPLLLLRLCFPTVLSELWDGDASLRSGVAAGVLRGLGGVGSVRGRS
ncbi:hypothetical protein YC2023_107697 [Brassica napus]